MEGFYENVFRETKLYKYIEIYIKVDMINIEFFYDHI